MKLYRANRDEVRKEQIRLVTDIHGERQTDRSERQSGRETDGGRKLENVKPTVVYLVGVHCVQLKDLLGNMDFKGEGKSPKDPGRRCVERHGS